MNRWFRALPMVLLIGILSVFALGRVCSAGETQKNVLPPEPLPEPVLVTEMKLEVSMFPPETTKSQMAKLCKVEKKYPRVNGCYWRKFTTHYIYAIMPEHWCDVRALKTIGHEIMHALGANHEEGLRQAYNIETACLAQELKW